MLFKKRVDYLGPFTLTYGQPIRVELSREFPIEGIIVRSSSSYATNSNSAYASTNVNAYNLWDRITLTVADGARTRNVVDVSGRHLVEYWRQINGGQNVGYADRVRSSATAAVVNYCWPMYFSHPQIADPVSSALLLPAPRYTSNPVLTLTPTAAYTNIWNTNTQPTNTIYVEVIRRDVDNPKWEYWDTELSEQNFTLASTGVNNLELPIPGAYTGIFLANRTSAGVYTNLSANVENRIQFLGNVIRRFTPEQIRAENEMSMFTGETTGAPAGCYYLDFLTDRVGESVSEVGSVLETNFLQATGARLNFLVQPSAANDVLSFVGHRIMGDISRLKMVTR